MNKSYKKLSEDEATFILHHGVITERTFFWYSYHIDPRIDAVSGLYYGNVETCVEIDGMISIRE